MIPELQSLLESTYELPDATACDELTLPRTPFPGVTGQTGDYRDDSPSDFQLC
jgi:hypothetical protein